MTANQIAAYSEQEGARHNLATEGEIYRHNLETERLESQRLEDERNYKGMLNQIQKEYNDKYIEYLNASEKDKVALESELNRIKDENNRIQEQYNLAVEMYNNNRLDEETRHNKAQESNTANQIGVQNKSLEYQKHQWDTENYLRTLDYGLAVRKFEEVQAENQRQYSLGLMNIETQSAKNLLQKEANEIQSQMVGIQQQQADITASSVESQNKLREQQIEESKAKSRYMQSTTVKSWKDLILGTSNDLKNAVDLINIFN